MKYLLTYEGLIEDEPTKPKYKQNLIIKSDRLDILYYLLTDINELPSGSIKYNSFVFYYNNGHEDNGEKLNIRNMNGNLAIIEYQILYQTDDFDDAVKMLNIIRQSDKFNL